MPQVASIRPETHPEQLFLLDVCEKQALLLFFPFGRAAADVALVVLRIVITGTANFIVIAVAIGPVITIVVVVIVTEL